MRRPSILLPPCSQLFLESTQHHGFIHDGAPQKQHPMMEPPKTTPPGRQQGRGEGALGLAAGALHAPKTRSRLYLSLDSTGPLYF